MTEFSGESTELANKLLKSVFGYTSASLQQSFQIHIKEFFTKHHASLPKRALLQDIPSYLNEIVVVSRGDIPDENEPDFSSRNNLLRVFTDKHEIGQRIDFNLTTSEYEFAKIRIEISVSWSDCDGMRTFSDYTCRFDIYDDNDKNILDENVMRVVYEYLQSHYGEFVDFFNKHTSKKTLFDQLLKYAWK